MEEFGASFDKKHGFTTPQGEVIVNEDYATLDVPLHEFGGHLYLSFLKQNDLKTYDKIIDLALDETEIAEKILQDYPELGGDRESLGNEIFSTMLGLVNQDKARQATLNNWEKISNIVSESTSIVDFFKRMFKFMFGSSNVNFEDTDSLSDIMRKIGDDVFSNDSSILNSLSEFEEKTVKEKINETISLDEIEQKLIDLGYIKKICS
jgi:hypothetical protein